jgi:alpha-L-rhamnosidase
MGLLSPEDWQAKWIGAPWQGEEPLPKPSGGARTAPEQMPPPAPYLRKTFDVLKPVKSAVVYTTGLGYFELYLNDRKVSDDVLVPNQTNYGKRPDLIKQKIHLPDDFRDYKVMYLAYDVTKSLRNGKNCIGAILGNGFYNAPKGWTLSYGSPRFIGQLHITYTDGSEDIVVSDGSWKASKGPILMDLVYHGEHYDARRELTGWCTPSYSASDWQRVALRNAPEGRLVAHTAPTDRVMKRLEPVSVTKSGKDTYFVDFGQEISGWLRLRDITGPKGHKINIRYICNDYSGDNSYIFSGEENASYAARFNWFVFSGVEIENWPGTLRPGQVLAEWVYTDVEENAVFEASNPLFNRINDIWVRSQKDNMHGGIASDCPHRERSGYTGDGQVACITVMHNFDARAFYKKWIGDMLDAQIVSTGYVPNGAPWQPGCGGGVGWGAAICIMPWQYYLHYGDVGMLADNYTGMQGYLQYMLQWVDDEGIMHSMRTGRDGNVLKWFNLGEWAVPFELMPDEMVHTFYLWRCADIAANTAKVLGFATDAAMYNAMAGQTRDAFHKRFYNAATGSYGKHGGNVLALEMGVPDRQYANVVAALRAELEEHDGHLFTGIFGTRFFFEVLADNGMQELAYAAMNKETFPGYGYWLQDGATTTREQWDSSNSHNHPMFGGGLVWFYRKLAGMQADPDFPGFRHIVFRPQPVVGMDRVLYLTSTPYGQAGIEWKQDDTAFAADITVPVGCTATVYIPATDPERVYESGLKADKSSYVSCLGIQDGYVVYKIYSGSYAFNAMR